MKKLMAWLAAGALVMAAPAAAHAQQAVTIGGVEATRVVIAPPASELARIIKAGLSTAYYGSGKGSVAYQEAQKLYYFYGARHFEPLWLVEGAGGKADFSASAKKIITVFQNAEREGLRPSDYLTPDLDIKAAAGDPQRLSAVETAFSAAALRYAQHAYGGRIDPRAVSSLLDIAPRRLDPTETLLKLAASETPDQILLELAPKHREFAQLKTALARFYDGMVEEQISIPDGQLLKPGMSDDRVPLLRARLQLPAGPEGDLTYDEALVEAVTAFQESLGLQADGVTGPATVAALNGGTATTKEDIIANMERWRWMPEDLGNFHVFVNIPEFRLAIQKNGQETYTTRVVVGTPKNQTPVFSDNIRHIVVNPYWNVPPSIANNEIAPRLAANPYYLADQNMELLHDGRVIDVWQVNWAAVEPGRFPFRIRQRPGVGNALGSVKFLFPNSHDVYLHDTPSKALFQRSFRAYSHGCVRVQNPMEFADALLANEPGLTAASLEAMYGPSERWVNLKTHVPVHLAYFTLRVDEDGTIRSYGDVYGHNKRLIALLNQ